MFVLPSMAGKITGLRMRPSLRAKLTLAFALVMAAVLMATGLFLYLRFASDLDRTIDNGLRSRAGDVAALVEQADSGLHQTRRGALTEQGQSFAQIIDPSGSVVDSTPLLAGRPLLTPGEARRALDRTLIVERTPGRLDERSRLLATRVNAEGRTLIAIVGASLEDRRDSLRNLATLLLIGGPVALLLASLAGYGVATAALRPVERMRRRATEISAASPGQRLPVPPSGDEISRLGATLNAMLERLEESFARERRFVADASHELRTPLAILKTELELALQDARTPAERLEALRSGVEETDRLAQLAEDLLVIARSDQGRLPVRSSKLDVNRLLAQMRERFAGRADLHAARIEVSAPRDLSVTADPLRIEQALANMLDNALRHGGSAISLSAREDDGLVELHVEDDGPGFPPELVAAAFERFTRADHARSRGGAGLGLAIVAAIAEAHGGRAGAANVSRGADVWIAIPAGSGG